ncbi:uncharacterized protein L969DRAFT_93625 [Mixia osmundae IAM 14324]|uniref:Purine nucleoside phosphorylase n=1 Tax=Mixia osmundae (strain CBS 9802 / IAM 14324 / JCM 22182 / KY 12970) TaxID=764103 RepID=G7DUI3_MIXOS|nr:uncharacterized protein L969DRAFT_93625 [Mixia osmundae IAM 14324]KEI41115.1 hypothetical protein L969DRAFT_93625 [Mixia osmundae IAM 14324]GAA94243.1 hypothetical protein E5Q_00892 [Mixia osmundae IAM 14324]
MSIAESVQKIQALLPDALRRPICGIVCGSGLSELADTLVDRIDLAYSDIGFAAATVHGHASSLAFGLLSDKRIPVVCQLGRFHAYEGYPLSTVTFPMRVMSKLGVQTVIITNAAGGVRPGLAVGSIVVLRDHISLPSLTAMNPLIGPNIANAGPRFPSMSDAYDFELRKRAFRAARKIGLPRDVLTEGTYAWVSGPTYETKAECRFLRAAQADVVGMSTVPEVIVARHEGLNVIVFSLVCNAVIDAPYRSAEEEEEAEYQGKELLIAEPIEAITTHQEVLDTSARRAGDIRALVTEIVYTF